MTIETVSAVWPPEFGRLGATTTPFACRSPSSGWGEPESISRSTQEYSLIFVVDNVNAKVLLGLKRRGMGVNLYNGFGGKCEPDETMAQCAARELSEESGLIPNDGGLHYKGVLYTSRPPTKAGGSRKQMIKIHLFACVSWSGEPVETEEMSPEWFDLTDLPTDRMWPEASMYLRPLLQSILHGLAEELFLARVDYELLASTAAPTALPPLEGLSVRFETQSNSDDIAERLSGWFMAFVSKEVFGKVE
ncbi:hypothetical protein CI109_106196 [Kwoniella shandongensis]|uniref:Nudix hydrolase domain-containing protein n=1 Tax=Kwoniella shandongensis TaxID=1734106 RepID=A0AAJ8LPS5_9TREE